MDVTRGIIKSACEGVCPHLNRKFTPQPVICFFEEAVSKKSVHCCVLR